LRAAGAQRVLADFTEPERLLQCLNDALVPIDERPI
jgi:hypothetical protein